MQNLEVRNIKIKNADPSSLGLFGLAMVTFVASSEKLGLTQGYSLIIPWALFLGAFAQLFACINDSKRGNVFGTTAFGAYSLFWFSMAMTWVIKMGAFGEKLTSSIDGKQLGFAFLGYLIFTMFMTIGATDTNKVLFAIFVMIDFLFIGLTLSSFGIAPEISHPIAAWSELTIAILSFYGSGATVLNDHFGRTFLPIGKPIKIFKNSSRFKPSETSVL